MTSNEQARLGSCVEHIASETAGMDAVDEEIAALVSKDPVMSQLAAVIGPVCAATIVGHIGSPLDFETPRALEKAMGLNLKERSSGEKNGRLSITKRGAPEVRQMLYLATLRLLQTNEIVEWWYHRRSSHSGRQPAKMKAVVAVMRKLARALWHVARGETFDAKKLFDVRRLDIKNHEAPEAERPKMPRPFVRKSAPQEPPKKRSIAQQTA